MPKVSVIVPVYNAENYIRTCLDSLIAQTLEDIEIICVDNVSTDASSSIVREYVLRDKRVKLIAQDRNRGQANSLNKGLMASTGEYVAECDADDWAEPDMYEKLYEASEGCDVVQCGFWYEFPTVTHTRMIGDTKAIFHPMKTLKGKNKLGFLAFMPHIMSAIYRRDFLIDNNIMYREGKQFEDTSLSFKIRTTAKRYVLLPELLYHYRQINPNSGTATINDMEGMFEQYQEICKWNKEHNLELDEYITVMRFYSYRWNADRARTEADRQKFWKRASEEFKKDPLNPDLFPEKSRYEEYLRIRDIAG